MKTPSDSRQTLVFDWTKPAHRGLGLALSLLITLTAMAAFFYLFRVIYPQSQRLTPVPQQVFVLNPADPAHQALINRVRDQDHLVIAGGDNDMREVHLDDHAPVFHPSFEKHEFQLQDLPRTKINVFPARILNPSASMLPPPDLKGLKPAEGPFASFGPPPPITLGFSGELSKMHLRTMPDLTALQITDPGAWRFHIGVSADGHVAYVMSIATGEEQTATKTLLSLLSKLRFDPVDNADGSATVVWSIVTLHWKTTP